MIKTTPDFLTSLRLSTKPWHQSLETLTQADRLMSDELNWSLYGRLIACHYLFHREVAFHIESVDQNSNSILDWPACKRIDALEKDLKILDLEIDLQKSPRLELTSFAYAMGLCYVAEGSCMGNQQLLKALQKYPAYERRGADHFFQSCRHDFSSRWKSFMKLLTPVGETAYADLEKGAIDGFRHFGDLWMYLSPYFEEKE